MQFLFVVLMSVLVGASALPHVLQAPNRPSFSLRKNTAFSLVAIPKFFQKVASLDKTLAAIEEEQLKRKQAAIPVKESNSEAVTEKAEMDAAIANQGAPVQAATENRKPASEDTASAVPIKEEVATPVALAPVKPAMNGYIFVEDVDIRACICTEQHVMTCQVWVQGSCTTQDQFIEVTISTDGRDFTKNFRCKDQNHFAGSLPVHGGGVGLLSLNYLNKKYEQPFNMINHCGKIGSDNFQDDD